MYRSSHSSNFLHQPTTLTPPDAYAIGWSSDLILSQPLALVALLVVGYRISPFISWKESLHTHLTTAFHWEPRCDSPLSGWIWSWEDQKWSIIPPSTPRRKLKKSENSLSLNHFLSTTRIYESKHRSCLPSFGKWLEINISSIRFFAYVIRSSWCVSTQSEGSQGGREKCTSIPWRTFSAREIQWFFRLVRSHQGMRLIFS